MSAKSKLGLITLSAVLSISLTACDPPMPESLRIAQAELQVQCEAGEVNIAIPEALTDLGLSWSDAASIACDSMMISPQIDSSEESQIEISEQSLISNTCEPFANVPVAIDGAVLVTNIPDYFEIYLSADQVVKIFSGEITNWSDPLLLTNNEEYPLPDLPIVLPSEATPSAKASLARWVERLSGLSLDLSKVEDASSVSEIEMANPTEVGAISITSVSAATYVGSSVVAIIQESGNPDSIIRPDYESLLSAKTQLVSSLAGANLSVTLDPSIEPQAEEGLDTAVDPYQAIYAVNMALCGEDSTLKRTVGRYLLRQDSQGIIATAALMPLPESVRIEAIQIVAEGLPSPSIEPATP